MKRLVKANKLEVIYSDQQFPNKVVKSIFLAGPTPRNEEVVSWRKEALEILNDMNFNGTVFVPEPSTGVYEDYTQQIDWELSAMKRADVILFWIPRKLRQDFEMAGLTTNVEFGSWIDSGKVVVGFPEDAEKVRYLKELAKKSEVECHNSLKGTLKEAIDKLGEGAARENGEVEVPLMVWNTLTFQNWYNAQKGAGNTLEHADLKFTTRVGPKKDIIFLWILHVDVFIASENRNKTNEFVVSRTNTSYTVIYKKAENILDTEVVLIKEFRSPAATKDGYVWELVGGSSFKGTEDALSIAADEIREETDFVVSKERISYVQERQLNSTLTAHKTSIFSLEINDEELQWFKDEKGKVHGNEEDTERTYIEVLKVSEILENELLDWSNIGMIMKVLNAEN
ncbi:gp334 [Bacillus phage G]|uniref:Gp334 n=1 Tax=Bacillus phage G TaxID=2884420 RepID=G3MA75_9CAUD|nr:gp334 [Bacillus phage G]AEO93593.1 gp334 [Bacillus phage G]